MLPTWRGGFGMPGSELRSATTARWRPSSSNFSTVTAFGQPPENEINRAAIAAYRTAFDEAYQASAAKARARGMSSGDVSAYANRFASTAGNTAYRAVLARSKVNRAGLPT